MTSSRRRKENEEESSSVVVLAIFNGVGESSCVLEKIGVGVFESCLQRPKDMILKGLSADALVMVS